MKQAPHFLPPRQSVIYGYTRRVFDETPMNANSFAMALAESYTRMVAPDVRQVPLRLGEGDALPAAIKNNAQILRRYMDGTVKVLPADLEDAWVMALPDPYRNQCERDLAQRRGLLSVRLLDAGEAGQLYGVADLSSEFGQLLQALAPALADGQIDASDLPYARRILNESDDLIARVLAVRKSITALLPEGVPHA